MAQYWEDWSGSTIGQAPVGWTPRWDSGATYSVVADANGPAGRALKIDKASVNRHVLSFDAVDSDANRATLKIRALVKAGPVQGLASTFVGVVGRASGTSTTENGHVVALSQSGATASTATVVWSKYLSAILTTDQAPYLWTEGDLYWVGMELSGNSLRRTLASAADPSTLLLDSSDTDSSISAAGWAGLFSFVAAAAPYYVYAVGIGTNGDDAPIAAPSGGTHALEGAATVSASASADLATAGPAPVKGVSLTLHSGQTAQANMTGITACWWDTTDPSAFAAPVYSTTSASTDASGVLTLDLDAGTSLSIGGAGFLLLYKAGAAATDDLLFAGRLNVQDIT